MLVTILDFGLQDYLFELYYSKEIPVLKLQVLLPSIKNICQRLFILIQ